MLERRRVSRFSDSQRNTTAHAGRDSAFEDQAWPALGEVSDGSTRRTHDAFRGMSGSFDRTMEAIEWANQVGLPCRSTPPSAALSERFRQYRGFDGDQEDRIVECVLSSAHWSRKVASLLSAEEFEDLFAKLYNLVEASQFLISHQTTEAQHYRRYVLQQPLPNDAAHQSPRSPHPKSKIRLAGRHAA